MKAAMKEVKVKSKNKKDKQSTGRKMKVDAINNESKQKSNLALRSDKNKPAYCDDEGKGKRAKKGRTKIKDSGVVTAEFQELGEIMNMQVTDEESRAFEQHEKEIASSDEESQGHGMNNNASMDEQSEIEVEMEVGQRLEELRAQNSEVQNKSATEEAHDKEEEAFMKRFAKFMEDEGYIPKKGMNLLTLVNENV